MEKTNATVIPEFTFAQKKYLLVCNCLAHLKSIGQRAFSNCSCLSGTLELPETVTAIEYGAFMGCSNLRSSKGKSHHYIGDKPFWRRE